MPLPLQQPQLCSRYMLRIPLGMAGRHAAVCVAMPDDSSAGQADPGVGSRRTVQTAHFADGRRRAVLTWNCLLAARPTTLQLRGHALLAEGVAASTRNTLAPAADGGDIDARRPGLAQCVVVLQRAAHSLLVGSRQEADHLLRQLWPFGKQRCVGGPQLSARAGRNLGGLALQGRGAPSDACVGLGRKHHL